MISGNKLTRLRIRIGLAILLGLMPVTFFQHPDGTHSIGFATLFAKSGPGSDGNGGDGGGGHGGHGGGHDDDDDDDDNGGSGNSGSGSENSGSGSSGSGSGSSGNGSSGSGSSGNGGSANRSGIIKIELTATGVEIRYADGSREEIKKGRYTFRAATGKIVVSRRATGADLARLRARANGVSISSIRRSRNSNATSVNSAKISGNDIKLTYSNGWTEEISSGRYKLKDQYNRTVVSRPASKADIQRLRQVAGR